MANLLANSIGPAKPAERAGGKSWYWPVRAAFHFWHLASLDAPTVAVVWGGALAWTAHLRLAVWPLALLGLVVWALYVGDRLMDARAGLRSPSAHELRERHYFHWKHRRVLAPLAAIAGVAALGIVRSRVRLVALPEDSVVAGATLVYFSGVHFRVKFPTRMARVLAVFGSRECLVGVLFAAGCVLPALSMNPGWNGPGSPMQLLALPAVYFAAVAWLNVRAITHWESVASKRNGLRLDWIAQGLAAAGLVLAAWLSPSQPRAAVLMAAGAASALLIGLLDRRRDEFTVLTLRGAVDMVLLTPLLLLAAAPLVR